MLPSSSEILTFHDAALNAAAWPETMVTLGAAQAHPIWEWVAANHRYNSLLWAEEDLARRRDVSDSEIAKNKRAIDGFNQARNDAAERIDETVLVAIGSVARAATARQHSETAGMMVDRLSIMSLKIKAMAAQAERIEAGAEHQATCRGKLERLNEQRTDLAACLDGLIRESLEGRVFFKIYRQFKMYNDPTLNPQLYASQA
jgi:hypothetical protein